MAFSRLKIFVSLALLSVSACAGLPMLGVISREPDIPAKRTITVYAAASLTEAFHEISQAYSKIHPDREVLINFAGSQQLAQQLSQGAPADVFASADIDQMKNVIQNGRVLVGSEEIFAQNKLVLITPVDNPGGLKEFKDITTPGLHLILADQAVPVGRYSAELLERADRQSPSGVDFKDRVMNNVVSYEENVRAVLSKVILGEGDAGIVYMSDLVSKDEDLVRRISIPDQLNVTASYFIAPVSDTAHPDLADDFIDFVLSPAGQQILIDYGFYGGGSDD
jgi:molybdate transport system substrate-binding protein